VGVIGARRKLPISCHSRRSLERAAKEGDSPVRKMTETSVRFPEYHGTRETPWESGGTILQGYIPVMTDSAQVP
jgi:hypothetical protein